MISSFPAPDLANRSALQVWNIEDTQENMSATTGAYKEWHDQVEAILRELDSLGVTVVISAGNDGEEDPPGPSDAYMPNILASQPSSPLIIVGAVNYLGQLASFSSPGSARLPTTCYAMGKAIRIVDLSVEEETEQDGTTFSAAIVVSTLCPAPRPRPPGPSRRY